MQHAMTTRRRKALSARKLLHLPDELLSMIMLEAMWACTLPESLKEDPDLESYQRRLMNHPSLQPEKVAFLGGICGQLRGIYKELMNVTSLWTSPSWSDRKTTIPSFGNIYSPKDVLPSSLARVGKTSVTLVGDDVSYLRLLPTDTFSSLVEMELFGRFGVRGDTTLLHRALAECVSVKTLRLESLRADDGGILAVLQAVSCLPVLRHLVVHGVYAGSDTSRYSQQVFNKLVDSPWPSHLVRLQIGFSLGFIFPHFVRVMVCSASSLAVAIFSNSKYWTPPSAEPYGPVEFPSLWKLSISFSGRYERATFGEDTEGGRRHLASLSPLEVLKYAPKLAYFDCSQPVTVSEKAGLDEVAKLVDREGWKRIRLRLMTWEGDKGERWTRVVTQDVIYG